MIAMPPFLPAPALTLAPLPRPPRAARRHPAPLAASSKPTLRRPYRRRPSPAPAPPQRSQNAAPQASFRARSEEELEAAIYDFMRRSDKPGAFPTRAELLAAGHADLAAAVESSGGWLSLGWSSDSHAGPASSSGGVPPHIFCDGALPGGERLLARVRRLRRVAFAEASKFRTLEPHHDAVEAPCSLAADCGGCKTQSLAYAAQIHKYLQMEFSFGTKRWMQREWKEEQEEEVVKGGREGG